ncbi:MAG: 2OG-Fe(II) oxygenase [Hyphomicrobiaceae bacterium]
MANDTPKTDRTPPSGSPHPGIAETVDALDWKELSATLDQAGATTTGRLLTPDQCADLVALYNDETAFRSQVVMARHGFGSGEYKYLSYPLPALVRTLRTALYPHLARIANHWRSSLGDRADFPDTHQEFLDICHAAGQSRPTPLLLKYGPGDYKCLHRDLYGPLVFPLQVVIALSDHQTDFTGGQFVLVEQRPRRQSRAEVLVPNQGEAIIFAVDERPVTGARGPYRVRMRHGVSRIHDGERYTLGIIFHDAA